MIHQVAACGISHPTAMGIAGGYPGPPTVYKFRQSAGSDRRVEDVIADPAALETLDSEAPNTRRLAPKEFDLVQKPGDIYEAIGSGAAGYGDPLDRQPEAVREDIDDGYFDVEFAKANFGVVVAAGPNAPLSVDLAATQTLREGMRSERLRRAKAPQALGGGKEIDAVLLELSDNLAIGQDAKGELYYCSVPARRSIALLGENYKLGCARLDLSLTESGPLVGDPREFIDADMQFRLFICPFTGSLIETEIARAEDSPIQDVMIDKANVKKLLANRKKIAMTAHQR
jgi:N-methylhydantoinase B